MDSKTRFARRFVRPTGALELMQDLALAGSGVHMLGGGNPARIPAVEAVYARRLAEIAADPSQYGRFAASYAGPAGDGRFRAAVAATLADRYGWPLSERNVALTGGSQAAFFTLFNLLAGESVDARNRRVLLPLSPEYVGHTDVGLSEGMLVSRPADIERLDGRLFKYRPRLAGLESVPDVAAICVSRPTNPSGNVLTLDELGALDALARSRGVPLIVDAAYGLPFPGIQFVADGLLWNDNVILCLSLSKLGLPATRTGIVVAAEPVIEAPPPVVELPRERPSRPPATLAPASRALVAQAAAQRKKGDLPGASVSLDRALRIEPNNPLLWIETGRLRMDQRNFAQAENMARKALAMSVGDDATQSAAWDLVGQSLKARGRNVEAEEAFAKAREVAPR